MQPSSPSSSADDAGSWFLAEGGESGALARSVDWSRTPLGPISGWPSSLRTVVAMLLRSRHPMFLWWGPELVQLYNDAYLPSFGKGKHPAAMGQRGRDCWQEIWPIIWPQIDDVMRLGKASWNEDQLVPILRNGRLEEVYWTYGYSPVFDDQGGIGGTLVVCTETTSRVIAERRQRTLRKMATDTALATSPREVVDGAMDAFAQAAADIPFALVYGFDPASGEARLIRSCGLPAESVQLFDGRYRRLTAATLSSLPTDQTTPLGVVLPPSPTAGSLVEAVSETFAVPLANTSSSGANGFVVFGLSPLLPFDDRYRDYLVQLAQQLVLAQARVEAFRVRAATEGERNNLLLQAPVPTAVLTGPTHVFRLVNPLYQQMVGGRELLGRTYVAAFPELADSPLPGILERVYRTGEPYVTEEMRVPLARDDGEIDERFFKFNLEPMRDLDGQVYGMMAVALDITEQVNAQRLREQSQREREKLLIDLEAASRAKDEFLAMLGHELRNPLSPIVTALELIKLRGGAASREHVIIERQVTHLVRLVDDLLDISKITRGKVELRREWVEVSEVLAKAVEMASYLLEQRSHRLSIDVAPGLRWYGDPVRLAQVVSNLLTNAARYTEIAGCIRLVARADGHEVVISVEDDGIGISQEMLPRIFDLFFQGKRNVDRAEGGLGIGLTLVRNLVSLHGGTIVALSEGLGKGSQFVIRLPVDSGAAALDKPAASATPLPPRPAGAAPRRILVVDDNEDAAELLAEMLRTVGHEVSVANDPLAALDLAARFRPEVALLDIGLPVMDGYELATRMRAAVSALDCRLFALTGYGQEHDRLRSREAGFAEHLVKPIDLPKLLSLIDG